MVCNVSRFWRFLSHLPRLQACSFLANCFTDIWLDMGSWLGHWHVSSFQQICAWTDENLHLVQIYMWNFEICIFVFVFVYQCLLSILFQRCGGGVWFDQTEQSKSTIENVQLVQLGGRLARLLVMMTMLMTLVLKLKIWRLGAGEKYKAKAETAWGWLRSHGIVNATSFQVLRGAFSLALPLKVLSTKS